MVFEGSNDFRKKVRFNFNNSMFPKFARKKTKSLPLVRVDDRLLHGQVVVGWAQALQLDRFIVASDRLLSDSNLTQAMLALLPPGIEGDTVRLETAAEKWKQGELNHGRTMILVEHPLDALKLIRHGAPMKTLTLGGMHFREEREQYLPYIFLSQWDRAALREICQAGVTVFCQDLPATKPVPYND